MVRSRFDHVDIWVKVNARFLYPVEKKLCKERIALGKTKTKCKSESSTSSEITLDSSNFIEDKRKKYVIYGSFVNSKNLITESLYQVNGFRW